MELYESREVYQPQSRRQKYQECMKELRWDLAELRYEVVGYEQLKKEVNEAILSVSLQYERRLNELKYQLGNTHEKLSDVEKLQKLQQDKAAELLEEIDGLRNEVKQLTQQNQHLRETRKIKQQSDAQLRGEHAEEVEKLNIRINDLLVIIQEKTHRLEIFQERDRKSSTAREVLYTDENVSHRANIRNKRLSQQQQLPTDKTIWELSQTHIQPIDRRHSKQLSRDDENSLLTVHTTVKNDISLDHQRRNTDSQILSKLQQFVSNLTTSHQQPSPARNELRLIDKTLQARYTAKPEWCNSLRVRDTNRRSSLFRNK